MSYLNQSNREQKRTNRPAVIATWVIGVVLFVHLIFPRLFPSLILRIAAPLLSVRATIAAPVFPTVITAETTLLQTENEQLKQLMGRSSQKGELLAAVLSLPPQSPYDTIIIDIGTDHTILVGKNVYASTTLIGRIAEVYATSAKVELFSSPGVNHDVLIGKDQVRSVAIGRGGGVYQAIVPRELHIGVGDPVSIPSLYGGLFGVVDAATSDSARAFAAVYFHSPINMQTLRFVAVEK